MTALNFKQRAHALIEQLPETAGWKDLVYEASVIQDIEDAVRESDAGLGTDTATLRKRFGLPE